MLIYGAARPIYLLISIPPQKVGGHMLWKNAIGAFNLTLSRVLFQCNPCQLTPAMFSCHLQITVGCK